MQTPRRFEEKISDSPHKHSNTKDTREEKSRVAGEDNNRSMKLQFLGEMSGMNGVSK